MKKLKYISLIVIALISFSCSKGEVNNQTEKKVSTENLKTITLKIEGMTCEIGCAKLIESKTSKLEGVTTSKVNFEEKKGVFTYDSTKITSKEITEKITGIADGTLYNVTDLEEL